MPITVFIVDDHSIFRNGLKGLISEIDNVKVIGEASNGKDFLKKLKGNIPDIVFMDIKMPVMNGIEATKKALSLYPGMKIIALSMYEEYEYLDDLMDAGAVGYMLKNVGKTELENAINNVMEGSAYFCSNMVKVAMTKVKSTKKNTNAEKIAKSFTNRELDVLQLICLGLSSKEISAKLNISPRTVDGHRNSMLKKSGFNNTTSLVSFTINNLLVKI